MKNKIVAVLIIFVLFGFVQKQEIRLQSETLITSKQGLGLTNPVYSPNGQYILTTSSKYAGLYILNSDNLSVEKSYLKNENVGYGACWSSDNQAIYFRKKTGYTFYVYKLDVAKGTVSKTDINPQYLTTKGFNGTIKNLAYIDKNRQLVYVDENQKENKLTSDNNNYYHLVMIPGQTKFVVHLGSEILLINAENGQVKTIGIGLANAISKNGKYVFYHLDSSTDGHHITNSELYVYDIEQAKTTQLTHTELNIELWADLSPDNNTLLYNNEHTGEVESIKIHY
jgi:hypothetical protein